MINKKMSNKYKHFKSVQSKFNNNCRIKTLFLGKRKEFFGGFIRVLHSFSRWKNIIKNNDDVLSKVFWDNLIHQPIKNDLGDFIDPKKLGYKR